MQTLLIVFGVIVLVLLVLILSVLGGIQKTLITYLMLTIRQGIKPSEIPLKTQKKTKKE